MARIPIIMLVAAVIGGGAVYGAMLYLDRNPVQLEVPALGSPISSGRIRTATTYRIMAAPTRLLRTGSQQFQHIHSGAPCAHSPILQTDAS